MYTRVESRFWQDEKMRAVSDDARYLMLYLLTSPHRNILGFYFLPSPYACFDLGWDEKRFDKGLQELIQTGSVKYDSNTHVVLVQNYLKHNPLENPNQVKSAIDKLEEIPQTPLFQGFLLVVKQFYKPFMKPLLERLQERLQQPGTGSGTETGSELSNIYALGSALAQNHSSGSVEAEKVTATLDDKPPESRPRSPFTSKRQEQLFDEFWAEYPKKRSKGQAEKTWVKLKPDEQLFEAIMTGLKRAKTSVDWAKNGGQYIPYPSTWLNAKGWEDEYEEVGNSAKYQGYTSGQPQSNRFAGLARNGGTGRVVGGQDRPLGSGNSPPPGDIKKCPGNDSSYQVTGGMPVAR